MNYLQVRRSDKSLIHTDGAQSEIFVVVSSNGVVGGLGSSSGTYISSLLPVRCPGQNQRDEGLALKMVKSDR